MTRVTKEKSDNDTLAENLKYAQNDNEWREAVTDILFDLLGVSYDDVGKSKIVETTVPATTPTTKPSTSNP